MINLRKKNQSDNPNEIDDSSSISSEEFTPRKEKNRRPKENSFTQQKLKAVNPIFTPKTIIPSLILLAIIFIPLGAAMLYGSSRVEELVIKYQQCELLASRDYYTEIPEEYVDMSFRTKTTVRPQWKYSLNESESDPEEQGICQLQFEIPNNIGSPVFFFYKLYDFYPNHRRFVKSFSEMQLNGDAASLSDIKDTVGQNCEPLSENDDGVRYYPCGLIANSLYNDTYTYPVAVNGSEGSDYEMTKDGIAWSSNKARFKKTKYMPSEVVPPPNWAKMYPNGYTEENMPDISTWYDFQNWMAPGGLPVFSKLYFRNDTHSLQRGLYEVSVGLHFPVLPYDGKKAIYISTRSVLGGKNSFLGIAWVVAGGVCLILASIFLIVNLLVPRKTGDLSKLSWNKEQ